MLTELLATPSLFSHDDTRFGRIVKQMFRKILGKLVRFAGLIGTTRRYFLTHKVLRR